MSTPAIETALRNLPKYISRSGLVGPDKHSAMLCFEVLRDALAQQPAPSAPVGDDRWQALIGQWQRRVEAVGYHGVEDALDVAIAAKSAPVGVEGIAGRLRNLAAIMRGDGGTERIDGKAWERVEELAAFLGALAQQPTSSAPVGVDGLPQPFGYVEPRQDLSGYEVFDEPGPRRAAIWNMHGMQQALAQQPAADGGFTAADMMDARQEGRKEAQQLAACRCVDCGGDQPVHDAHCPYMHNLHGQQTAAVEDDDPCPSCYGSEEVSYCGRCGKGAVL